jgi:hypothetical protein
MSNQLNNIRTVRVEAQELIAQIKLMKWFKETLSSRQCYLISLLGRWLAIFAC